MTCTDYQEWISADLDAELGEEHGPELWAHLASCASCRQWRRDFQGIHADFLRWPEESLPEAGFEATPKRIIREMGVYRVPRLVAWAAVIAVFVEAAYIASPLVGAKRPASLAHSPMIETVETITLGPADRVQYRVVDRGSAAIQPAWRKTGG